MDEPNLEDRVAEAAPDSLETTFEEAIHPRTDSIANTHINLATIVSVVMAAVPAALGAEYSNEALNSFCGEHCGTFLNVGLSNAIQFGVSNLSFVGIYWASNYKRFHPKGFRSFRSDLFAKDLAKGYPIAWIYFKLKEKYE